jgi:hypothetical protein
MQTGYLDGALFLAKLEDAQAGGDADYVAAHMPRLERLIVQYQDRIGELAQLQSRARTICARHEPRAEERR